MMKAWVLSDIGNICLNDVDVPNPGPEEVLIRVQAAGICGSDIPRIYESGAHMMPLVTGHEFSGVVEGIGKKASPFWMRKRVGIFPMIPCGHCRPCVTGHPEMCRDYDYIGSRRDGAFAEYVTVPEKCLIELPEDVSFEEAAMLEPMAVAVHAIRQALDYDTPVNRDSKVVVCGLGTIGMLIVMFLIERGYENVFVIGNKPRQMQRAMDMGISTEQYYDSSEGDAVKWVMNGTGGGDVFFECVGKNECVKLGVDVAASGGRVILVGNPYTDMTLPRDAYWNILRNQLSIRGTWNSTFLNGDYSEENPDDWHYVLSKLSEGRIHPGKLITHRFRLDELDKGFHIMQDKTEDYCKVMMVM